MSPRTGPYRVRHGTARHEDATMLKIALMVHAGFAVGLLAAALILT